MSLRGQPSDVVVELQLVWPVEASSIPSFGCDLPLSRQHGLHETLLAESPVHQVVEVEEQQLHPQGCRP